MAPALLAVAGGLVLLVWSADRFVEGAAATARRFGLPSLLIGMVVVGFGTSAPEMMVSAQAAQRGAHGIAIGNAYGSNIANIALILGLAALVGPITVRSRVLRKELPVLVAATALAAWQIGNGVISRTEAVVLLAVFAGLLIWTIREGRRGGDDALGAGVDRHLQAPEASLRGAILRLVAGLVLLIVSSRILVWGAAGIARTLGVDDLVIGLTIVAVGTSLPELASSIAAVRKREPDIALGNVLGSNLFNTLAVVGVAGAIRPLEVGREVLTRDLPVMAALTVFLFAAGLGRRGPGRIDRLEGAALLAGYVGYVLWLVSGAGGG